MVVHPFIANRSSSLDIQHPNFYLNLGLRALGDDSTEYARIITSYSQFHSDRHTHSIKILESVADDVSASEFLLLNAIAKLETNDHLGAWQDLSVSQKLDPKSTMTYFWKGIMYCELQQYHPAEIEFTRAVLQQPQFLMALLLRGIIRIKINKHIKVKKDFAKILAIDPLNLHALFFTGYIHNKLGEYAQALKYFDAAIEIHQKLPELYLQRGIALHSEDSVKAAKDFQKAFALGDKSALKYLHTL